MGRPRIGLVLGAGGIRGGAWIIGALRALHAELGWNPANADLVVGTSAGAMIAAMCAGGVDLMNGSTSRAFKPLFSVAQNGDRKALLRLHRPIPWPLPGSPALALRSLRSSGTTGALVALAGWLPRGPFSTEPLRETVSVGVPGGWPGQPELWIVACNYQTGRRVVFGRRGAPRAELADAVAASCAIPGFYHPVAVRGCSYIDGGVHSPTNLDLLRGRGLDLVICINPIAGAAEGRGSGMGHRITRSIWAASRSRLHRDAAELRAAGTHVLLIHPTAQDTSALGFNPMDSRALDQLVTAASRSVRRRLRQDGATERLPTLHAGPEDHLAA